MRVLFVCTADRHRSPTAERLFSAWPGLEVSSAGVDAASTRVLDAGIVEEAELIFVIEPHQRETIRRRFRAVLGTRRVLVPGIPDIYDRDQPELIALLRDRVPPG